MLLTAILFTAIVVSVFNLMLISLSTFQHRHLKVGVGGYFFALLVIYFEHIVEYAGYSCKLPFTIFISAPFYLLLFPLLHVVIHSFFGRKVGWNKFFVETIPALGYTLLMVPFYLLTGDEKCRYHTNFVSENVFGSYKHLVIIGILATQTIVYSIVWYKRIKNYNTQVKTKASTADIEFMPWVSRMLVTIVLFTFSTAIAWIGRAYFPGNYLMLDRFTIIVLSLIPCIFLFLLFFLPERPFPSLTTGSGIDSKNGEFSNEDRERLVQLMKEEKLYLDSDLNLSQVAGVMEISRHDLSALLKLGFQKNFYDLVNEYRIGHAKTLMKSELIKKFSLSGIARESGFNNYVSFYRVFKRFTNQTPSEYLQNGQD